ncbi:LacI family DNA-binding transcriptional regulator [Allomuricauda sp. SCSIO 65647]|uniref:LacI family DNA-binding transcriptional regulator n=1 Tax=Allomuricauda sp. SCSIO 65647 TaxID=2908843 RepID=UPI001F402988|nr:LacI family DNA-binding transcriptional regulator [Muricauda sp. SCSIO 65647]UJH66240.1 LacI family transcriptional regulator [Muricauda sp. SCSIO 65647]
MLKKKITLKHIARELEVSISTVSKALKNSEEISRDTKEKIQAFAKLYNYKPNNIAISLKNKRTKNIGVVIPDIVHHFFTTVVRGIENFANKQGYNVIVCLSDESFDKEVINMEMLANGSIDGFIMSLSAGTQEKDDYNHLKEVTEQGIPVVLFDRVTDEIECDKVVIDDLQGGYMATKKLIDEGRKRIALLTTYDYFSVSRARNEGYKKALHDHGLEFKDEYVLKLPYMDVDEKTISNFFDKIEVDGVLSVNEIFGIYAMRVLQRKKHRIPKDISVIGFTDGLLSQYANPSMTSVAQHGDHMGETAARMLIEKVESDSDEETFKTEIIQPTIVSRESTLSL